MKDAFAAIDNGGKLRKPDELPFDICFGGRRQFCNSHYADLGETHNNIVIDSIVKVNIYPVKALFPSTVVFASCTIETKIKYSW